MLRGWCVSLSLVAVPTIATSQDYGSWYFRYLEADRAGDLNTCTAAIAYSNSYFAARLFDDEFDFIYFRDDFTLPFDQVFGSVIFRIDGASFTVAASTNAREPEDGATAQLLFFLPKPEDKGSIFNALRAGRTFWIEFPNGDYYEFPLTGSRRAFQLAQDCWSDRPTGSFSNNPFEEPEGNNPFGSL